MRGSFSLIKIICLIILVLEYCYGYEDEGARIHNELILNSIQFKIYNAQGQQIYPFDQAMLLRVMQCGITASIKFEDRQIIYLTST